MVNALVILLEWLGVLKFAGVESLLRRHFKSKRGLGTNPKPRLLFGV